MPFKFDMIYTTSGVGFGGLLCFLPASPSLSIRAAVLRGSPWSC